MTRKNTLLRAYMAYDCDPSEGAVLVFAFTASEAHRLAWPELNGWGCERYVNVSVRTLERSEHIAYLRTLATSADPHVIGDPPTCLRCERWGAPINENGRGCGFCGGDA